MAPEVREGMHGERAKYSEPTQLQAAPGARLLIADCETERAPGAGTQEICGSSGHGLVVHVAPKE
jgi:hypothetical protein